MAACPDPKCPAQYEPSPDQQFCVECGTLIPGVASSGEQPDAPSDVLNAPDPPAPTTPLRATTERLPAQPSSTSRTNIVGGDHAIAGGQVTVIQYHGTEGPAERWCAVGNESLQPGVGSYRCPECDRNPVCADHYAPDRGRCAECVNKSDELISTLNDPDIVIDPMGQVVAKSKVRAEGDTLVSDDGERVATIKPNIWYAAAKQWHEIKPRLLSRERQAVTSMYPGMTIGRTSKGSIFWTGTLTTSTGNSYDVRIQYPPNFPYIPPRAYVVNPKIKESRHIYKDGHLCLFHKDDKVWQNQTTAATMVSWTALWLHCYEVWVETGEWPRRERDQVVVQTAY